jgi:hypothetical protein
MANLNQSRHISLHHLQQFKMVENLTEDLLGRGLEVKIHFEKDQGRRRPEAIVIIILLSLAKHKRLYSEN